MRGKEYELRTLPRWQRITPAYAGKRIGLIVSDALFKDHPRVCGEKDAWHYADDYNQGSPPRMRGKGTCNEVDTRRQGITPAYAGKSCIPVFCSHW